MNFFTIGIIVVILLSTVLKVMYVVYVKNISQNKEQTHKIDISFLDTTVSYEQFEQVSKESLVPNGPTRIQGDFMDFLLENRDSADTGIESKILKLKYGDEYGQ